MNEIEKAIWISVYSAHMANFQKRYEYDVLTEPQGDYHCQEAIDWAHDTILALRRNAHHLPDEIRNVLDKPHTSKTSVDLDRLDEVLLRGT